MLRTFLLVISFTLFESVGCLLEVIHVVFDSRFWLAGNGTVYFGIDGIAHTGFHKIQTQLKSSIRLLFFYLQFGRHFFTKSSAVSIGVCVFK